jgi:hypothetical protein
VGTKPAAGKASGGRPPGAKKPDTGKGGA